MTGTLGLFSLVDLFQLLSSSSRTGRLGVFHPEGNAKVYFDKGKVVHAEFNTLSGDEAVYALFANEQGSFEFQTGLPAPENTVAASTENLLLEAIRRLDEARRDGSNISQEAVPVFVEDKEKADKITFQSQDLAVLNAVNGRSDIKQIAGQVGIEIDEAKRIIDRLIKLGAIKLQGRKPRTARLVVQLSRQALPTNVVGVEVNILAKWERTLGYMPQKVACRRQDGRVDIFWVAATEQAGPYFLVSRETLVRANFKVNMALLVRPVPQT